MCSVRACKGTNEAGICLHKYDMYRSCHKPFAPVLCSLCFSILMICSKKITQILLCTGNTKLVSGKLGGFPDIPLTPVSPNSLDLNSINQMGKTPH